MVQKLIPTQSIHLKIKIIQIIDLNFKQLVKIQMSSYSE